MRMGVPAAWDQRGEGEWRVRVRSNWDLVFVQQAGSKPNPRRFFDRMDERVNELQSISPDCSDFDVGFPAANPP